MARFWIIALLVPAVGIVFLMAGCNVGEGEGGLCDGVCSAPTTTHRTTPSISGERTSVAEGTTHPQTTAAAPTETKRPDTVTSAPTPEEDRTEKSHGQGAHGRTHTGAPATTTHHGATAASAGLVSAIGDSAMLGAVDALQRKIPNLALVDAQGSRQAPAAIGLLRQYRTAGHLGDVVVVHIGNNGPFTAQEFDEMMRVLSGVHKVLVVNLTVPPGVADPVAVPNNAVLANGVRRYPNKAVLVNWYAASAEHPAYLYWDGIHLTPRGAQAYANLIGSYLANPEAPVKLPSPRKIFSWGEDGLAGECVGPPSWCLGVVRS